MVLSAMSCISVTYIQCNLEVSDHFVFQIRGSDKLWATLTWPTEADLWSDFEDHQRIFTGGIPCLPGTTGCSEVHNSSARAEQSGFYDEAVDGQLKPTSKQPIEFLLATKGEGVYGIGLTSFQASKAVSSHDDLKHFQATIAAEVRRCSPGHIPVAVESATSPETVSWSSHGSTWYSQCVVPTQLYLNQPSRVRVCLVQLLCAICQDLSLEVTAGAFSRALSSLEAPWSISGSICQKDCTHSL